MYKFLQKVPLFADLDEASLEHLCQRVEEVYLPAGAELFAEGSPGDRAYVIKEGQIEVVKVSGGRDVLLAVHETGGVIGEIALLEERPRMATVRARSDSLLLAIGQDQLDELLNTSPSAARVMLQTIISRWQATESLLRQSEKMAQLGTLTAGVAHELNNPAAAVQSGAHQLQAAIAGWQEANLQLNKLSFSSQQLEALTTLDQLARERATHPLHLDPLARSDCETAIEDWLYENSVPDAWDLAPILAAVSCDPQQLAELVQVMEVEQLPATLVWLGGMVTIYNLLAEIGQGAGRLAEIVKALKTYAYLDQAPVQEVNVHEGLDNTLIMLRSKLRAGVTVRRDYTADLPRIQAYGSELNQVWTNIIDNAVDAMEGQGEISLRTHQEENWVVIEIEDNGRGIPESIQSKIFDPFFTTKPPGKGTGLGLNISYNVIVQKHRGQINVSSRPGKTIFQVRLPINFDDTANNSTPVPLFARPPDEKLRHMLETSKNIAVVGISTRADRPAHTVPAYLQRQGYHILPVNPKVGEALGEKAYPDLTSLPETVDIVLIFRRSEAIPAVIDEAIQIGAKAVWMQEGIINESAALMAQAAGLDVIMDICMRSTHRRLMQSRP